MLQDPVHLSTADFWFFSGFFVCFCMTSTEVQQYFTVFSYHRKFEAFRNIEKNREINTAHFL